MLIVVNYHYIRLSYNSPHPGIHGVTPEDFEAQLRLLGSAGVFISAEQICSAIPKGVLPKRALLITFDDGLREQYVRAWPVLKRLGIPALFFINTAPILSSTVLPVHKIHLLRSYMPPAAFMDLLQEQAMRLGIDASIQVHPDEAVRQYSYDDVEVAQLKYLLNFQLPWSQRDRLVCACFDTVFPKQEVSISKGLYMTPHDIRELGRHGCIGSHTHDHLPLARLPAQKVEQQISQAVTHLKEWTGSEPSALSYPYGSQSACSEEVGMMAAAAGTRFAFTMERAGNKALDHPLFLARFDCNDVPGGKACRWTADRLFDAAPAARWFRN